MAALSLILFAAPGFPAGAQEARNTSGWSLYPSAEVGAHYDDNLFFRRNLGTGSTVYTRFAGTLAAIRNTPGSRFRGSYGFVGEVFHGDREPLTQIPASQRASVELTSRIGAKSAFYGSASYHVSWNPSDVFDPVDIEFGRRRAEGYGAGLGFDRQLSSRDTWSTQYGFGFRELGGITEVSDLTFDSISHSLATAWSHQWSSATTGTLRYLFQLFLDERRTSIFGLEAPLQSHVIYYSWSRRLGPRSVIELYAGPNLYEEFALAIDGSLAPTGWAITPYAGASFTQGWQKADARVAYARAQNQFVGRGGRVITDRLSASLGFRPWSGVSFRTSAGVSRNQRAGDTFETYRAGASAIVEITRWWSLHARYDYSYQERYFFFLGEQADPPGAQRRNRAYLGIVIGKTLPLE